MADHKGKRSIRSKILSGYLTVVVLIALILLASLGFLAWVESGNLKVSHYQSQQLTIQEVISSHYKWLNSLNQSIQDNVDFTGSLDYTSCSLGKWIAEGAVKNMGDIQMSADLDKITTPHQEIHTLASELLELSNTDKSAAYVRFSNEIRPRVEVIGSGLTDISQRFKTVADTQVAEVSRVVVLSVVLSITFGALAIALSVIYALRISKRISRPLVYMTRCSEALAKGIDNLDTLNADSNEIVSDEGILEIERMMTAFTNLAKGIKDDVSVIQRITEGDLTVFVDIKSAGDPLGMNLYHLVQNNDMMFANLLRVADAVAQSSENIALASQRQAQEAVEQAGAVSKLSTTVSEANNLAVGNAQRAQEAAEVSEQIRGQISSGNDQMKQLLVAVSEISEASQKISSVMKAIDDIAFQTNILALNAAVEAARAGSAGKGFAVVADEVRNLALKSAQAAHRSSDLIQNTVEKTAEGTRISQATSKMFSSIVDSTSKIAGLVTEISTASDSQQQYIDDVYNEIQVITQSVSVNAATSEETAAATEEMSGNAALIRREMKKFNLRQRNPGQPYIPAEKADDADFIRLAKENYDKALHVPAPAKP